MANWLDSLFIQILNMSITAGYCIAAVLLIRLLFRKAPRKYLYPLWLVVAFRLLCPVSVSTDFSLFNLEQFSESRPMTDLGSMQYIPDEIIRMESSEIHTGLEAADRLVNQQIPRAGAEVKIHGIPLKNMLHTYGFWPAGLLLALGKYVWAAGVAVFLAYFMVSMRRLKRNVRMAVRTETCAWKADGRRSGPCGVYECDGLASPFAMGIFHPKIYLPCHLSGEQRKMILLHEQYHIYRKDHLVKLLAFFLLSVYWFHPLVWAAWFGMCKDMEMSCDEKVLETLGEEQKKAYGLTLLAFASDRRSGRYMPLGFGEHDVKSRIKHTLSFRKPTVRAGAAAVTAAAAVLLLFGTNGAKKAEPEPGSASEAAESEGTGGEYSDIAQKLYDARNPYIGDASANGRLLRIIAEALPDTLAASANYKMELQTSEEPYEFHFLVEDVLEGEPYFYSLAAPASLMLALTDNMGEIVWKYSVAGGSCWQKWSAEGAAGWCGVEDIKEYSKSPEKVQELLDLILTHREDETLASSWYMQEGMQTEDEEDFEEWYSKLPYEFYEDAMTLEEYNRLDTYDGDQMVILAQTNDGIVTVYGCYSVRYGTRGITIDYRITPDGDSNHNDLDLRWSQIYDCKLAMADYDRDGRDEIALTLGERISMNRTAERLVVFETYETGHAEPFMFTPELQQEELSSLVASSIDTGNHQVHIVQKGSESSVPVLSISCDPDKAVTAADLSNAVSFELGEEIYMNVPVGLRMGDSTLVYGTGEEWTDRLLRFRVVYDDSASPGSGYFTLTDVSSAKEAEHGGIQTLQQ